MRELVLSVLLGCLSLLGVAALIYVAWPIMTPTVDGLFTSLILLLMAGIFFFNAALELRALKGPDGAEARAKSVIVTGSGKRVGDARVETGTVEDLQFFEAT